MKETIISLDLSEKLDVIAFIRLIRELNESGVPYDVEQDELAVTLKIGDGY